MADQPLRMPGALIERAQALVGRSQNPDFRWEAPVPRHAATVVMVRDLPDGLHVYLQRRVRTMAFAAGMYVFPGGAVDPADLRNAEDWLAANPAAAATLPFTAHPQETVGEDTLAARFAAVRETQEETSHDLGDPTALSYIAHWVTPEVEDRRYDTRFYALPVTEDHHIKENSGESDADRWLRPADALAEYSAGAMLMLPPTVAVLSGFAEQAAAGADAAAAIAALAARPIVPLMPHPVADPDDPTGLRWRLVDVRTGEQTVIIDSAPAGSESGGVHTSLSE
jgi:8-oxo-dGTP pyrophosphatase MutT (NUDIX family)